MLTNPAIQINVLTNIKRKILHALKDINKEFFFFHAETARFELAIEFPLYTLSRRAPSTTRTRLHFYLIFKKHISPIHTFSRCIGTPSIPMYREHVSIFNGRQKYSIRLYKPNIFSALAVVITATSGTGMFFSRASFSTTYFK